MRVIFLINAMLFLVYHHGLGADVRKIKPSSSEDNTTVEQWPLTEKRLEAMRQALPMLRNQTTDGVVLPKPEREDWVLSALGNEAFAPVELIKAPRRTLPHMIETLDMNHRARYGAFIEEFGLWEIEHQLREDINPRMHPDLLREEDYFI